jgi:hypothetical protein
MTYSSAYGGEGAPAPLPEAVKELKFHEGFLCFEPVFFENRSGQFGCAMLQSIADPFLSPLGPCFRDSNRG